MRVDNRKKGNGCAVAQNEHYCNNDMNDAITFHYERLEFTYFSLNVQQTLGTVNSCDRVQVHKTLYWKSSKKIIYFFIINGRIEK